MSEAPKRPPAGSRERTYAASPGAPAAGAALPGGGGGGTFDGVDAGITKFEVLADLTGKRLDRVETKIDGVAVGLARLEERVAHLPTKDWIASRLTWTIGLMIAATTVLTLFQAKVQGFLGLVPR